MLMINITQLWVILAKYPILSSMGHDIIRSYITVIGDYYDP